jgi:hypothetical protein
MAKRRAGEGRREHGSSACKQRCTWSLVGTRKQTVCRLQRELLILLPGRSADLEPARAGRVWFWHYRPQTRPRRVLPGPPQGPGQRIHERSLLGDVAGRCP